MKKNTESKIAIIAKSFAVVSAIALSVLSHSAAAQDSEEGVYVTVPSAPLPAPQDGARFRFAAGGSVDGKFGLGGGVSFGPEFQLGLQLNDAFAIYWKPRLAIGLYGGAEVNGGFLVESSNPILFELTVDHKWQFGLGPSFDFVAAGGWVGGGPSPRYSYSSNPVFFGAAGRVAYAFGEQESGRRSGLVMALDLHAQNVPNAPAQFAAGISLGYQAF